MRHSYWAAVILLLTSSVLLAWTRDILYQTSEPVFLGVQGIHGGKP